MQRICQFSSAKSGFYPNRDTRNGTIRCIVHTINLNAGRYYVNLAIIGAGRNETLDHVSQAAAFDVIEADVFGTGSIPDPKGGSCYFPAVWDSEMENPITNDLSFDDNFGTI